MARLVRVIFLMGLEMPLRTRLLLIFSSLMLFSLEATAESRVPWLTSVAPGWSVQAIMNTGENIQGYRMAGIPDGLGILDNGDGTLSITMNHEIAADKGSARLHGGKGAFISRWKLDTARLTVTAGEDLTHFVNLWNPNAPEIKNSGTYAFNRLCSADLAAPSAFFDASNDKGFNGRLLMNGEEDKSGGRVFAHVLTGPEEGVAYELPHFGKAAWENAVANPHSGHKTVVIALDDSAGGQVYVYVGEKHDTGNPVERAGLVYGRLYAIRANGARFDLIEPGDVTNMNGAELEQASQKAGATPFLRPEDGAWDPRDGRIFYFATTDKIDGNSQLFRLTFDDARQPELGGRIEAVLNASDIGAQMFDNITVDGDGRVLIDEDPGKNVHPAGLWLYEPGSRKVTRLFEADHGRFVDRENPAFMTEDEEQSGIVDVTDQVQSAPWFDNTKRYYLGVTQAHVPHPDPALVEYGQLYLISGPRSKEK